MRLLLCIAAVIILGPAVSVGDAASPAAPSYVVILGKMTAFESVNHKEDTDYISLWVQGPEGQQFSQASGPQVFHRGVALDWALSSGPITLSVDQQSVVTISWAAVSKKNASPKSVREALANATAQIAAAGTSTAAAAIASSITAAHGFGSCDAPLFGQSVSFDGASLAAGLNGNGWSPDGTNAWHAVFDYNSIRTECPSEGHYNLEITIRRQ